MLPSKSLFLFPIAMLFVAWGWSPVVGQATPDRNTLRFINDVLFDTEYAEKSARVTKRWVSAPKISTFGSNSHHPNVIENVVKQLNECLPKNLHIQILERNDPTATLQIYFVPVNQFETIAAEKSFEYVVGNWGFFHTLWNGKFEIVSATVLISEDKLSGSRLHHFVLEEVTQSLGLPGDSNRFEKSIFYENQSSKRFGKVTRLSKLDRQLIQFHYGNLTTGLSPIEVGVEIGKSKEQFGQ